MSLCEAPSMAMARGREARYVIKDDDVESILEKVLVEDCGLIVSTPVYHLRANGYFEIINERMLPAMFRNPEISKKTRVGELFLWTVKNESGMERERREDRSVFVQGGPAPFGVAGQALFRKPAIFQNNRRADGKAQEVR